LVLPGLLTSPKYTCLLEELVEVVEEWKEKSGC